jgi:hypothetical protein
MHKGDWRDGDYAYKSSTSKSNISLEDRIMALI